VTDLIFVEQKPMEGREQELDPGATIGREGCDVVLMDPEVSRRHAAIRDQGGSLAIEDLGSTNGTYVNDVRVTTVTVLRNGDVVRLGNTVWAIRSKAPAGAGAGATAVGQVPPAAGAPQVTAARPIPTDIQTPAPPAAPAPPAPAPPAAQPAAAQPVPAAAVAAAPQQPAQPAAPSARPVGPRGDVEAPPEVAPSAIRRVLPPPAPGQAPAFSPPPARKGGSAATRVEATVVCMLIVAAVAAALVVYFATY
jgi:predicted component of type VI protein secretion system